MPRTLGLPALAVLLSGVLACTGVDRRRVVSDSTFVATMADLRRIGADTTMDSTSRDSARAAILRKRQLTPQELERAARALADDPEHALAVWQKIEERANERPAPTAP
jgi:hypothetical protein